MSDTSGAPAPAPTPSIGSYVAVLETTLTLLEELASTAIGSSNIVTAVISTLVSLIPAIAQWLTTALPAVKNIITLMSQQTAVTPEQLAQLQSMDATIDANFDAAVAAWNAANPDNPIPVPTASA